MFKYTIPSLLQWLMPSYTWKVDTNDKLLFLTFDDGPHPQITPWVLDQLKSAGAKATFFCVADNVKKFPEIYSKILSEGHRVGNHTFNHLKGWETPDQQYFENIELAAGLIESDLFRPPYGRIKPSQMRFLKKKYRLVMWNRLSRDFDPKLDVEESINEMKKVGPGSIVVFHDSEKAFQNLRKMLPELLEFYRKEGWDMCSLPSRNI